MYGWLRIKILIVFDADSSFEGWRRSCIGWRFVPSSYQCVFWISIASVLLLGNKATMAPAKFINTSSLLILFLGKSPNAGKIEPVQIPRFRQEMRETKRASNLTRFLRALRFVVVCCATSSSKSSSDFLLLPFLAIGVDGWRDSSKLIWPMMDWLQSLL